MAKYDGKNDNKTLIGQTHYRAKYQSSAFKRSALDGENVHESIVDFNFSEMCYYGKIDTDNDPVVVNTTALNPLVGTQQDVKLVVGPIKEMFRDFQRKFVQAVRAQKIPEDDAYLANPFAHHAFIDPIREYKLYMSDVMDGFNKEYLSIHENNIKVTGMASYIEEFMKYMKVMSPEFPITLTAWRKSKRSSLLSTGMAISISDLDCSKDSEKEIFIFDKNCTTFYYQACKQYGFSVSKICPWVLVADIAGAGSRRYLTAKGVTSARKFFTNYYIKTYTLDLKLLKTIIRQSYSEFIKDNVFFKKVDVCNKDNNRLVYKNIFRKNINKVNYNKNYDVYYWIPYYIKIRNIEDQMPYDEPSIVRITQKASEFEKILDKDAAMGYINEQFRKKYRYAHGSYLYYIERAEERKRLEDRRDDEGFSNY